MQPTEHAVILEFVVGLAMLWFGFSHMWRRTRLRAFREDVFTMRDELFDYMWKHKLPYSMTQYQEMRNLFNGTIRLAQDLRGPLVVRISSRSTGGDSTLQASIRRIEDPLVRAHFEEVFRQFGLKMVTYIGLHWFILSAIFEVRRRERQERFKRVRSTVANGLAEEIVLYGRKGTSQSRTMIRFAHAR